MTPASWESEGEAGPIQDYELPVTQRKQRGIVLEVKRKRPKQGKLPALTRLFPTLPDLTRRPATHRQLTGMSLSAVRAVDEHRRESARTGNRLRIRKRLMQKRNDNKDRTKNFRPTLPDFTPLMPTWPDFTRHRTPTASHHITGRTTLVHLSFDLVRAHAHQRVPHHSPSNIFHVL